MGKGITRGKLKRIIPLSRHTTSVYVNAKMKALETFTRAAYPYKQPLFSYLSYASLSESVPLHRT